MYCKKTDFFSGEVFKENFTDIFYTNLEQIAFSIKNTVKRKTSLFVPKAKMLLHIKIGDYLSSGDKIGEKASNIHEPYYVSVASHLRKNKTQKHKSEICVFRRFATPIKQNCNRSPCMGKTMHRRCKKKLYVLELPLRQGHGNGRRLHKGDLCFMGFSYKCKAKLCKKIKNKHFRRTSAKQSFAKRFVPYACRSMLCTVGASRLQSKALYPIDQGTALMQSEALRRYAIRASRSNATALARKSKSKMIAMHMPTPNKSFLQSKALHLYPMPFLPNKYSDLYKGALQEQVPGQRIFRSSRCKGNEKNIRTPLVLTSSGRVVMISKNQLVLQKTQPVLFYDSANLHVKKGEFVLQGAPLLTLTHQTLITGDIVQGIPRIEQLFEAFTSPQKGLKDKKRLNVHDTLHSQVRDIFRKNWLKNVLSVAVRKSLEEIGSILLEMIQKVYLSQGVLISDKHIEIIIRQMTSKGQILDSGSTGLLLEEVLPIRQIENANITTPGKKCLYVPSVVGLTAAALTCDSFISAASFQETTRVLSRDAVVGKTDFLRGLKEKVVIGDLISAGTGLDIYFVYTLFSESI